MPIEPAAARRAVPGAYVASLSFRTVTYKALCAADQLGAFYPELRQGSLEVPFAIFHQRFSTNTSPSWERAQPFRLLCHNGEINTIDGNVRAMRGRGVEPGVAGVLEESGSDSSLLDNALELLVRGGRDVRHAASMLLPRAWQEDEELDPDVAAFHSYHAGLVEPWDGPAAIVFTDGRVVGAALDRNGLRPLRVATAGSFVACASEAGAVPLDPSARVRRSRLGPGELLAVDPGLGFEEDAAISRRLARSRPYRRWLGDGRRTVAPGQPLDPPDEELTPRQLAAGYTREDITLLLRPSAADGHEPTSSMGDDTALPPLAGRARPLFSYLRQRFAQVTNPPIDHLRERSLMSLRTLIGRREPLLSQGPEAAHLIELESFFLYPSGVAELRGIRLSTVLQAGERLDRACERLAAQASALVDRGADILVLTDEDTTTAIPALLALGAVHQRLVASGRRSLVSLVVVSDEPRDSHHLACLLGYGADAVCPRLALETVAALAAADRLGGDHPSPGEAQRRFRAALEDGVLKVMAKMGIADVASYRGAQLFEALGLAPEVIELCLTGTPSPLGGIGFAELERELRARARPRASSRARATSSTGPAASRTQRRPRWPRRCRRCRPRMRSAGRSTAAAAPRSTAASPRSSTVACRSSRATCSSSSPPARPCRSTRSSLSRRSCAVSRAAACRTGPSPPRPTRPSRSRSTGSAGARTAARAARIPRASATSATPGSSRSHRDDSASRPSTQRTPTSSRSRSPRARSPVRAASCPATRSPPRLRDCGTPSPVSG